MDIDLKRFCAYPGMHEVHRRWTETPFSCGAFSYATNGHIMVRVPRRDDVSEVQVQGKWDAPLRLEGRGALRFVPLHFDLPEAPETGPCLLCDGRGHLRGCPEFACEFCGGCGWIDQESPISTEIGGGYFRLSYVRRIAELPDVRVAIHDMVNNLCGPLQFNFDGGIGALMPLTGPCAEHVEVCGQAVGVL
ncbi:hypothetical protein LPW26_05970 [Rhodopseudomonas sp. HC1]|uniref:hypothetical protein n=1 Tax=Rhodopseudomonas infernalis TaxID=2897386 RepID=UPI001EE7FDF0|nr:hypothetical protein [Rhodopseudomonas infernalis]MCG6204173.1 hypothetical protein [Rhodopseudomonas infernalis]